MDSIYKHTGILGEGSGGSILSHFLKDLENKNIAMHIAKYKNIKGIWSEKSSLLSGAGKPNTLLSNMLKDCIQ